MFGLVSIHTDNYLPLSCITWDNNKLPYAKKHNYKTFCSTDSPISSIGFYKIHMLNDLMHNNPEIDWFWWTGTDSLITNTHIKIEHKTHNNYHLMMSVDFNGINCDSFLIRNSTEGKKIIADVLNLEHECSKFWDAEQRAFALVFGTPTSDDVWVTGQKLTLNDEYKDIVKILPQSYMNSYNYELYHPYYNCFDNRDKLGYNGDWNIGDWLIHWPATSLDLRIQLANHYMGMVL